MNEASAGFSDTRIPFPHISCGEGRSNYMAGAAMAVVNVVKVDPTADARATLEFSVRPGTKRKAMAGSRFRRRDAEASHAVRVQLF